MDVQAAIESQIKNNPVVLYMKEVTKERITALNLMTQMLQQKGVLAM